MIQGETQCQPKQNILYSSQLVDIFVHDVEKTLVVHRRKMNGMWKFQKTASEGRSCFYQIFVRGKKFRSKQQHLAILQAFKEMHICNALGIEKDYFIACVDILSVQFLFLVKFNPRGLYLPVEENLFVCLKKSN